MLIGTMLFSAFSQFKLFINNYNITKYKNITYSTLSMFTHKINVVIFVKNIKK